MAETIFETKSEISQLGYKFGFIYFDRCFRVKCLRLLAIGFEVFNADSGFRNRLRNKFFSFETHAQYIDRLAESPRDTIIITIIIIVVNIIVVVIRL